MHSIFAKRIPKSENMAMRISLACVVHAALSTSNLLKLRLRLAQTDVQAEKFFGQSCGVKPMSAKIFVILQLH
jgi:hypothetical protein